MSSCQGCGSEVATHGSDCIEELCQSYEGKIERLQRVARAARDLDIPTGASLDNALDDLQPGDLKPHQPA